MKKILGIVSNIISIFFVCPFSLYFSCLGVMLMTLIDFDWTLLCIIYILSCAAFLSTLPVCILGIILSIVLRREEKYQESYFIQLLPMGSVIIGAYLFVVTMILG